MEAFVTGKICNYFLSTHKCAKIELTKEFLIKKIRLSPSDANGMLIFEKFNSFKDINYLQKSNEVHVNDNKGLVSIIQHNLEILDFFEIKYPAPPKEIAHLFKTEQPKIKTTTELNDNPSINTKEPKDNPMKWPTGPDSFQKTNVEAILRDLPKQPTQLTDLTTGFRDVSED